MSGDKRGRNAIWVYAVILFMSAFIVLLLTAYSQIKFNKNIDEYKNKISTEESAKNNINLNLGTALSENKRLNEELKTSKQENEDLKNKLGDSTSALNKQQQKALASINAYDLLISAQVEYSSGNIIKCADILYNKIDSKLLGNSGNDLYKSLIDKVYGNAAGLLYKEGYKNYINKNYETAIDSLYNSYKYAADEYFSDDCLYFTAYSYYRLGNMNEAKAHMQKMLEAYPDSNYKKDAMNLLKELG